MLRSRGLGRRAALVVALGSCVPMLGRAEVGAEPGPLRYAKIRGSADVQKLLDWIQRSNDHGGLPFAVVDKRNARLFVFDARGALAGETAALLGSAAGDHSEPGVGQRTQSNTLKPEDRTTPAGRFESAPGQNHTGEAVVWVDYATAFAIHRVRPGRSQQARELRLGTSTPDDNRVSSGCVVVPVGFYERVVLPVLGSARGVVYVLPETKPWQELFGPFRAA